MPKKKPMKWQLKLEEIITNLAGEVGRLRTAVDDLRKTQMTVVFPAQAMDDLTGELRAIRYLLDKEGRYSFMDKQRAQREVRQKRSRR